MDKLLDVLKSIKDDVDYENCETLIDAKVFDSIELIELVAQIEETFDIEIEPDEISPENFNSLSALWTMIERLK